MINTFSYLAGEESNLENNEKTNQPGKNQALKRLSTKVNDIPLSVFSQVCVKLNVKQQLGFNDFRMLAEKVGLKRDETDFIDQRFQNPTEEIVNKWSQKGQATVAKLIEWLKEDGFQRIDVVEILEDWVNERLSQWMGTWFLTRVNPSAETVINGYPGQLKINRSFPWNRT